MSQKRSAHSSAKSSKRYKYAIGVAVLLLGITLLIYQERHTSFVVNATTRQPQPYTELYFTQPDQLPSSVRAGQTLPVAFTVHNVEARQISYTYSIDFTPENGRTTVLRQRQLVLADGRTTNINEAGVQAPNYIG